MQLTSTTPSAIQSVTIRLVFLIFFLVNRFARALRVEPEICGVMRSVISRHATTTAATARFIIKHVWNKAVAFGCWGMGGVMLFVI